MWRVRAILAALPPALLAVVAAASAGSMTTVPGATGRPPIPAYVARPEKVPRAPGVLVLHGCEGFNGRYAEIADGLARHGFVAVAIDSLTPRGVRNSCGDPAGSRNEALDARTTLAWMRTLPYVNGARLALLGYSMGSVASLDVIDARHEAVPIGGLRAAVAYYPACRDRKASRLRVPLRIFDGTADTWTPAPPCQALANGAKIVGTSVTITTYPGATHAFNVDAPPRTSQGHELRYDPVAAADAAARTLDFLRQYLRS